MSDKIMKFYTPEDTDHQPVSLDLTGKTAVIIRRSKVQQQEPSRFQQEQLVAFAKRVRGENEDTHIRLYTDGAQGATNLLEDITNGLVSSIIAECPDRLLRSEHALTTNLLQKQHIIVVVPGKRVYDFSKEEDVKAFQMVTQEAYQYIATQIKHMKTTLKPYHIELRLDTQAQEIILREDIQALSDQEAIDHLLMLAKQHQEARSLYEQNGHSQPKEGLVLVVAKTIYQQTLCEL